MMILLPRIGRLAVALAALLLPRAGAAADAAQVVETGRKLAEASLDGERSWDGAGRSLSRPAMQATFDEGRFFPITRPDGRLVGLIFEGKGTVELRPPAGVETVSWQQATDFSAFSQPFTGAHLRFTDGTASDLGLDGAEGDAGKDRDASAFRTFEARDGFLTNPLWTRWAPNLVVDQLMDLYGGGHVGGHVLAEFKVGDGPAGWVSYLHNPRGALMPGETTSIYTVRPRGGAPPELNVIASFGESDRSASPFDVATVDLDVTFPTPPGSIKDLVDVEVKADLQLVNLRDEPLKAVVLELASERPLCTAQPDRTDIRIKAARDADGTILGAVHRGSRLFVALDRPVPKGGWVQLHLEYEGPMTQGVPYTTPNGRRMPDTFFSELGPWAWYPRNPHLDRFASKVTAHMPRFMSAVAPGDLVQEDKGKDGWTFSYEEPGGVRQLTLAVGAFTRTEREQEGNNPRIIAWAGDTDVTGLGDAVRSNRGLLQFVESVWGPFPYTTLHVVQSAPYPSMNWLVSIEGAGGAWSCVPPDQVHPWQGFVEQPSGMLLALPVTAPATDLLEGRGMSRLLTDPIESTKFLTVVNLTRQWWGHLVPPRTYRDVWITEAMATWTGLLFLQAGVGPGALKERMDAMRQLMVEGADMAPPLAVGERLGRHFGFQAWSRGPLLINRLVESAGARPFLNAANSLMRRGAGPGVDAALFNEAVETMGGVALLAQARHGVETVALPAVEYSVDIDKEANAVLLRFRHDGDPAVPVELSVHDRFSPKDVQRRTVRLDGPYTEVRYTLDPLPRKVEVDPLRAALVRSLKKVREVTREPGEGEAAEEQTESTEPEAP